MPIQQMLLGAGGAAVATKPYVDNIFSTFLYTGNETNNHHIQNGIDLTEGGLVWMKDRGAAQNYLLVDSEYSFNNSNKYLISNLSGAGSSGPVINSFDTNGFKLHSNWYANWTNHTYSSWTFRKAPGFFDIVTYTGNGSARTISHSLGSVPGCIIIKSTSDSQHWAVFHCGIDSTSPEDYYMRLNESQARTNNTYWNDTAPTATEFSLGIQDTVNGNNKTYVAYIFAGGESTAATACSVNFNAGSDYLTTQSSSYNFGTGDFTIEFWTKLDTAIGTNATAAPGFFQLGTSAGLDDSFKFMVVRARNDSGGRWQMLIKGTSSTNPTTYSSADGDYPHPGQWYHVALVRHSSKTSLYVNGERKIGPIDDTTNYNFDDMLIGSYYYNNYGLDGQISNFRIVKGSAVYTSSFKPPTAPLTSITNTILLCCQSSTITAATTIPGTQTISSNGSPAANTSHPFDDPAGFVFGENEDENVIKCGSYVGNGSTDGPEINLGFEPSWVMIKCTTEDQNWLIFDCMRGIVSGGNDNVLYPNLSNSEVTSADWLRVTPTGFKINKTSGLVNDDGDTYIHMCIRRPDGYVGKPRTATELFAMDYGNASSTSSIATYDSGFPVGFSIRRQPATSQSWYAGSRLTGTKSVTTDTTDAEVSDSNLTWDRNDGVGKWTGNLSSYLMWMWKRSAGFDCICFKGNGTAGHQISHSMNKQIEMIWIKNRDRVDHWRVGHKGLNGGTNPWQYQFKINDRGAESASTFLNNSAPTSTHFTVGSDSGVNHDGENILVLLFATTDVSYVGSYTAGSGSSVTITTGFQPRFLWAKNVSEAATNNSNAVFVFDTLRGWTSGNDQMLDMSSTNAQSNSEDFGAPTSTGFTLAANTNMNNGSDQYVFYAHA